MAEKDILSFVEDFGNTDGNVDNIFYFIGKMVYLEST